MKLAAILLILLTACAQAPKVDARCEAGGGCLTMTKVQLVKAIQEAWLEGHKTGEENAPPICRRWI